jgi:signal transduction histidine kinase
MPRHSHLDTEAKLRERVKELTCLYKVVQLATMQSDAPISELLQGIAELLPPGWQFPEITCGRVVLDDQIFETQGFKETAYKQSADIVVRGVRRGFIEVVYLERRPRLFEGPFLKEERNLINALAREVSGIVERYQTRIEKADLEEQLRHADRLATLGQLAAGVAHELNEPLGNILGFAQLAQKSEEISDLVRGDLQKIVAACLHSREIINKLKFFTRQIPVQRTKTDLNEIITERLFFIESRCAKYGIEIERQLDPDLPLIFADPSQLHQILINLMVNAVQAMPDGGKLTLATLRQGDNVLLTVKDTGIGISKEILSKIFLPFFTTKDADQGTGLGLSVVDNIIKSHHGEIRAASEPGRGTIFHVLLPIETHRTVQEEHKK